MQTSSDHPQNEILKRLMNVETKAKDLVLAAELEAANLVSNERAALETARKLLLEKRAAELETRVREAEAAMVSERDSRLEAYRTELRLDAPDSVSFGKTVRTLLERIK